MSILEALWLGVVQGLTEFLPVSSSGHLVMFQTLFGGRAATGLIVEVALHVATLVAIVIFYWRRIVALARDALRLDRHALRYGTKLGVASVPAAIVGLTLADLIAAQFEAPVVSGVCLLVTGAILWTTRRTLPTAEGDEPSWGGALLIGCAQALAILPGISRSGTTVATALALGVRAEKAAEFSFLMGVIAIGGAAVLTLPEVEGLPAELLAPIAVGSLAGLVFGVLAIWLFVKLLAHQTFHYFSYYTWAAGLAFLAWLALR